MSVYWIVVSAIASCVALFAAFAFWKWRPDPPYAGYGWRLGWRERRVIVLSRLLESPSGRAGVGIGNALLTYNGHPLEFETGEDFAAFFRSQPPPKLGERAVFRILDGEERDVELEAETIRPPIPYYPPLSEIDPAQRHLYRENMHFCRRTGQIFFTRSLTNEAIDSAYG